MHGSTKLKFWSLQVNNCHRKWIQHISRMVRSRHAQAGMKYEPAGNGNTGRPLERHLDCNVETGTAMGKSLQTWWWQLKNKRPTWCHLLFYFTSYVLNMFRTLLHPSSGACDYSVELPHWSYCSWFDVCCSFGVVGLEWYPCYRLSRKLLMMDIIMSEKCWAHKKWNKIAIDIKLVFYSLIITMMHDPINISDDNCGYDDKS